MRAVVEMRTSSVVPVPMLPVPMSLFILLGIDELMDMARTSLNVLGNSFATCVIARWEGEFGAERPSAVVREALD